MDIGDSTGQVLDAFDITRDQEGSAYFGRVGALESSLQERKIDTRKLLEPMHLAEARPRQARAAAGR